MINVIANLVMIFPFLDWEKVSKFSDAGLLLHLPNIHHLGLAKSKELLMNVHEM
jgi:hypothetical protein